MWVQVMWVHNDFAGFHIGCICWLLLFLQFVPYIGHLGPVKELIYLLERAGDNGSVPAYGAL